MAQTRQARREKERRQRHRPQQTRRGRRSPLRNQLIIGGVITGAVLLGILGLRWAGAFEPPPKEIDPNASEFQVQSGQKIGTLVDDAGKTHIPAGQPGSYNSDPPTSGDHWASTNPAAPAPWGIKDAMLPREVTTHNLEHGGIVIAYNNLSTREVDQLKSVVRSLLGTQYRKIILEPYPPLGDAKVALTAWRWILKLQNVDTTQIIQFVRAHYADQNYAPEWNTP